MEDFESVDRLLETVVNDVARAEAALEFLRLIHKNDIMMYEDRAFRKFLSSLDEIEDADTRSSTAHDLAANHEIRLTNEQCQELFQLGRTGYYRYEMVAEIFGRMELASVSHEVIETWIAETQSLVPGEDDNPDTAWFSLMSHLAEAGMFDEALSYLDHHVSPVYQGYLACSMLGTALDFDKKQNAHGENMCMVIEFLGDHPDIQFVVNFGDMDEGQLPKHSPRALLDV